VACYRRGVKLVRLEIENFTAFEHAVFDFSSGVNVLIGENGTGKSHVLKLIYCLSEANRRDATGEDSQPRAPRGIALLLMDMLEAVFSPTSWDGWFVAGRKI
jgi:predicted ATPase